jgi:VanZ family protein
MITDTAKGKPGPLESGYEESPIEEVEPRHGMPDADMTIATRHAQRWYALLALGSASFTLFGSLVPFEFHGRPWSEVVAAFAAAMTDRLTVESRSDVLANVMLGVPLGFALLGLVCVDRVTVMPRLLLGLCLLPACCLFAAFVEFLQLYLPMRTCSGSDVLAQTLGAAIGMAVWLACGQRLTEEVRKATGGTGTAGRFLVAYVLLLGFVQALPFDLSLSPGKAYHKFKDGKVQVVPFGEFKELDEDGAWARIAKLLELSALYLPVGLLAGSLPGRFWTERNADRVFLAAVCLAAALEAGQVLVQTRTSSATDVVVGSVSAFLGWAIARRRVSGAIPLIVFGQAWLTIAGVTSWQPFDFEGPGQAFDWVPGMPLEGGNPLVTLEILLTKLVFFGLGGVILTTGLGDRRGGVLILAATVGALAAAVFEAGQTMTNNHTPGITDVFLGGAGALAGTWAAERVRYGVVVEETAR